jgi:hypothetical protein
MTTATASERALKTFCDDVFPPTGAIGYVALLKPDLTANLSTTANATADTLTATAHGLTTGSRFRLASTETAPAPLLTTQDYYAIVTGANTFKAAVTLADAIASTAINLVDAGSGSIVLNEQSLTTADPLAVLLAKEITHPAWTVRAPIAAIGAASIVSGSAEKNPVTITVTNTNATALTYGYVLLLFGDTMTNAIGSLTGIIADLMTIESTAQSIAQGESKSITVKLRTRAV